MTSDWHELSSQGTKFKYKIDTFSDNPMGKRFNRLNHEYMLITVASYGGPIALTSDKTQILTVREDDPSIQNICIYNNEGELSQLIKLVNPFKNIVIFIGFLQDQMLMALFQQGQIWLIDPHTARINKLQLLGLYETEEVKEAKIFQNGFALLTNKNRFLYVRNAYQPQCMQFMNCEQQLKNAPHKLFWTVFSPKNIISEKVELHICHPSSGIVQVVEQDSKRLFYNRQKREHVIQNKLPNLRGITYISELSPNNKMIVYFLAEPIFRELTPEQLAAQNMKKKKDSKTQNANAPVRQVAGFTYKIAFAPSLTSDSIGSQMFTIFDLPYIKSGVHVDANNSPVAITWVGNKAVTLQLKTQQLYMYSVFGDYIKIERERGDKNKWSFLKQEIDGTRILTKTQNKILRQIPASYISIHQQFSQEPGALLHTAYEAFEQEKPMQDDQIRKEKKKLAIAVEQCIKASKFQININKVITLMKTATYGKAFLPPNMIQNDFVLNTTKILRIVNCLRNKNRYITYEQLQSLKGDMLLKILLRYRQHYLAFEIHQYLGKDTNFRIKIYTDWACCKVQNYNESEQQICQDIRNKLQSEKGISFTQIAHRAIEVDRSDLALRLLSFEPSLAKKIPLLLWMGAKQTSEQLCDRFFGKALEEALRSRDLNLLFLTIRKIMTTQKISRQKIFDMFTPSREGRAALLNYFRLFDSKGYIEYNRFFLKDMEAVIMQYLRKAFAQRQYQTYQSLLQCAVELLKQFESPLKDDWRKHIIPKVAHNLTMFTSNYPNIKYRNDKIKPVPIMKQLQVFLIKKDGAAVEQIKSKYNIQDKRVMMAQIKVFIDSGKWQELQQFVEKHQKKYGLQVELIADMVFQKKEPNWGMKLMALMPLKHKQEQYILLQRISKFKEVIELAASRKDVQALQDIAQSLNDANLRAYANQKINMLRRR